MEVHPLALPAEVSKSSINIWDFILDDLYIAPVSFSYFDPKKEKYFTLRSSEHIVDVVEGQGTPHAPPPAVRHTRRRAVAGAAARPARRQDAPRVPIDG